MGQYKKFLMLESPEEIYHATHIHALASIIKDNAIKLTMSSGADALVNENKYYYLSCSRVKYGRYSTGSEGKWVNHEVVIDINARAVSANAKVKSIDYWGKDFQGAKGYREEQEERIMSDKPSLSPLSKFVNSIHIYLKDEWQEHGEYFYVSDNYKKLGLSVYFYTSDQAFRSQQIKKAITDLRTINPDYENKKVYHIVAMHEDGSYYIANAETREQAERDAKEFWSDSKVKILSDMELEERGIKKVSNDEKDLSNFLKVYRGDLTSGKDYQNIVAHIRYHELDNVIGCDVHNLKFKHSPVIDELVQTMKQAGFRNVSKFIKHAEEKIQKEMQ